MTAKKIDSRLSNLVMAVNAAKGRLGCGSLDPELLEEIGYLTMCIAALEESVSVVCETLLTRPELGGFLAYEKSVLAKQFKEKLNLLKMLIRAGGILYGINVGFLEANIVAVGEVGEDRNTVVHGLLHQDSDRTMAFHSNGRSVPAVLSNLRKLTEKCQEAEAVLITNFCAFYRTLVGKKSISDALEKALLAAFESGLKVDGSLQFFRNESLKVRGLEGELIRASRKLEESKALGVEAKKALAEAKRVDRNARARERRRKYPDEKLSDPPVTICSPFPTS